MYRSPNKEMEEKKKTTEAVCRVLGEMSGYRKQTLICGDFNYPEIDWKNEYVSDSSEAIGPFIDIVQDNLLYQHVYKPTPYRTGNEPSLLDLVFTNEEGMIRELQHNPGLGESDHECIDFQIDICQIAEPPPVKENYFKADYKTIWERLNRIDWEEELSGDFLTAYERFENILRESKEGCTPKSGSKKKDTRNMYFTNEAVRKKDLKNKLWRKYKKISIRVRLQQVQAGKERLEVSHT